MILYIVQAGKKHGIGHLRRALLLIEQSDFKAYIAVKCEVGEKSQVEDFLQGIPHVFFHNNWRQTWLDLRLHDWQAVVLDMRILDPFIIHSLQAASLPMVVWDGYGLNSRKSEILINPLFYSGSKSANLTDLIYQPMEKKLEKVKKDGKGILISMGGSDPAQAARKIIPVLVSQGIPCTLVEGPLCDYSWAQNISGVKLIKGAKSVADLISESETVITGIGLTLVEALRAGRRCIVYTPTTYHEKIAVTIPGVLSGGRVQKFSPEKLITLLDQPRPSATAVRETLSPLWWKNLLKTLISKGPARCPVCGSLKRVSLYRQSHQTLFECGDCRSNYIYRWSNDSESYQSEYFQEHYREVYGKDYLADIDQIRGYSRRRIAEIKKLTGGQTGDLLDFGSAYGIFLDEARLQGFQPLGVEISRHAVKQARNLFSIQSVPNWEAVRQKVDVITSWFTVEHMPDPVHWLQEAALRLKPGGILALGLPHGRGLLGRFNPRLYFRIRPAEHEFEPSWYGMEQLLKRFGFRIERTCFFGLHPDRLGLPAWGILKGMQRFLGLGDTFEIYARKLPSSP